MLFQYGKVVTGKYFFDRTQMQRQMREFVRMNQSFMLKAPRRFGKTSLIAHLLKKDNIEYLYIDFRKTPRVEIVNEKIIEHLYLKMGIRGALKKLQENAISFLLANRTTLSFKTGVLDASVELFSNSSLTQENKFIEYLDMLNQLAVDKGENFYIVLDEFQDIKKIASDNVDILERLRGALQHHSNLCYIMAGSNMSMMTEIFENSKSGFFNSCRKLNLEPFNIEELCKELIDAFKGKKIIFEKEDDLKDLLLRLKGHPANTILVMQNIEILSQQKELKFLTTQDLEEAYMRAFEELSDLINEYLKEIKSKEHLHDVIFRMARGENQLLDANSLRQKRGILLKMGYIGKLERGKYYIVDGFLEEDLLQS
jgi:AAA+ ATPase superfamily predicted ATPase